MTATLLRPTDSVDCTDGVSRLVHTAPDGRQWVWCDACDGEGHHITHEDEDEDGRLFTSPCRDCDDGRVYGQWTPPADDPITVG